MFFIFWEILISFTTIFSLSVFFFIRKILIPITRFFFNLSFVPLIISGWCFSRNFYIQEKFFGKTLLKNWCCKTFLYYYYYKFFINLLKIHLKTTKKPNIFYLFIYLFLLISIRIEQLRRKKHNFRGRKHLFQN